MSLYIHIPFCRQKCSYCNFYSLPINKASNNNVEQTCRRILLEIDRANTAYQKAYKTVFIGGGNPGILSKELLEKILIKVSENGSPSEVTIECNPENITDDLISLFQKGLATRLSTGIQSLSGKLLKNIGRSCADTSIVLEALKNQKLSQRTWIMNVDLIVGIPGQSLDDIIKDIHEIFEISKPEHFSIYDLTYEPGTPLFKKYFDKLQDLREDNEQLLQKVWHYMKEFGYHQYEISNFARLTDNNVETFFCMHNLQYWEMKPYLGIGPGAASTLFNANKVVRIECEPNIETYRNMSIPPFSEGYTIETLTNLDYMKEKLIMGLRLFSGINLDHFRRIFGESLTDIMPATLKHSLQQGNMKIENSYLKFTPEGMMSMNTVLVDMFIELEQNLSKQNDYMILHDHSRIDLTAVFEL